MTEREQVMDMYAKYTVDELKQVCKAIQDQIMHGNGAADIALDADLNELQDEYRMWSSALERKLKYVDPAS